MPANSRWDLIRRLRVKVQFYNATLNNIQTYLLCCSLLVQGALKFWFSAHHYASLIPASRS